jgi:hypothetical protein
MGARRKTAGLSPYWEANHRNIRAHMCDAMLHIFGRSSVKTLRQMRILLKRERASPALLTRATRTCAGLQRVIIQLARRMDGILIKVMNHFQV